MGLRNRKHAILILGIVGVFLFLFGQNFELVPRNRLFDPQGNNYMDLRMPAAVEEFNPLKKYFFDKPPRYAASDMTLGGFASKSADKILQNYFEGAQFANSEMGKKMREIESRTQTKFVLGNEEAAAADGKIPTELTFYTNSTHAYFVVKSELVSSTCHYSLNDQTIDVQFQTSKLPSQSFGMGYDAKSASGSVTMQMNW